jgi:MFS family permease
MFLTPLAGVFADRWDRRRTLAATQTLSLIQALLLAALTLTGLIQVWHLVVLNLTLGLINALDIPTRQAFIVNMIENKDDLANAIALNSSLVNGARLAGPALAGALIGLAGEGICFLLNAGTYLAVIIALLAMRLPARTHEPRKESMLSALQEGAAYVFRSAPMRALLFQVSLISFMGISYAVLMPVFAKEIFHGGPHTLGFLMSASGMGALLGALHLARRPDARGLDRWVLKAGIIFGAGLISFSFAPFLWLGAPAMIVAGFGMMIQLASSNTMLQLLVDDDKRGRLMSFYTMAFMGVAPFGSLYAGALASRIGAPATVMIGGACCLLGALWFALRLPKLRPEMAPMQRGQPQPAVVQSEETL